MRLALIRMTRLYSYSKRYYPQLVFYEEEIAVSPPNEHVPSVGCSYKHLATSSFSDAISILPPEENPFAQGADMGPNGMPEGHAMPGNMPVPPLRLAPADLQGGNAIFEFIRTLMPWVNVDQLDQAQVDAIRQELQEVVEGNQGDHHGRNPPLNDHEQD